MAPTQLVGALVRREMKKGAKIGIGIGIVLAIIVFIILCGLGIKTFMARRAKRAAQKSAARGSVFSETHQPSRVSFQDPYYAQPQYGAPANYGPQTSGVVGQ